MSFSANWGNEHDVCKSDVDEDLTLENGVLSPPLDQLADDVKQVVKDCANAAIEVISNLPDSPSGLFLVSAYGHVRQDDSSVPSGVTITVNEKTNGMIA